MDIDQLLEEAVQETKNPNGREENEGDSATN